MELLPKIKRTIPKTVWLTPQQARDLELHCQKKRVATRPATFIYNAILLAIYGQGQH